MAESAKMLKDLKRALKDYAIEEKRKPATFFGEPEKPTFLAKPALRVAKHFDLQADLLVWSRRLGSLGIVHLLDDPAETEARVKRHIDQAAYMRHLILTDEGLKSYSDNKVDVHQAATVELVLVAPHHGDSLARIGQSLDRVVAETSFLHAVGINILPHRGGREPFSQVDLRRALCWLLQKVEAWYSPFTQPPEEHAPSLDEHDRLDSLELKNYRLAGKRLFRFHDAEGLRLHLLHGRNGSGKSTIVEALELAWTGEVERFGKLPPAEYDNIVRHRGCQEPASITLKYRNAGQP